MAYEEAVAQEPAPPPTGGLRRAILLEQSMVQVADRAAEERRQRPAPAGRGRSGSTMQLIRAVETVRLGAARRCVAARP
eukprot:1145604-Lingulodinium_polyedra.AAC.1